MIKDFILPDIGEGVVECELVEWLVAEGDMVEEDQPIADVMTDKALVQIPAPNAGKISKLYYAKGDIAIVHQPLYAVEIIGEGTTLTAEVDNTPSKDIVENTTSQLEDFLLPDIGEGIVECELVEWLVAEGDEVVEDQPIADVMTDKALVQIPAIKAGEIAKLYYAKGEIAIVHKPLFAIQIEGQASTTSVKEDTKPQDNDVIDANEKIAVSQGKALASPAVRRMARMHDVDISKVAGTGKNGRVYKHDIEAHLISGDQNVTEVSQPSTSKAESITPALTEEVNRTEPIRGIKAVMAKMMQESVSTIPHFTYCDEIDVTDLMILRNDLKSKYSSDELKLTMMPFFMKALSLAINEYPVVNSRVNEDCTELTYLGNHNIGMAVDSKVGLLVPNVKSVESKSILEVASEITRLTKAAREGRVAPSDLKQGTISISNIGALGGTVATPIINKPEVAIVALGKVQKLPRFNAQGDVEARYIMQVSWSGDHRIIDGTIARFCNLWKQYLEQPQEMLLAMK